MTPEDRLKDHFWTMLVALCAAEATLANAQAAVPMPVEPPPEDPA